MGMEIGLCLIEKENMPDSYPDLSEKILDEKMIWYGCGYGSLGVRVFQDYAVKTPGNPDEGVIPEESVPDIIESLRSIVDCARLAASSILQIPAKDLRAVLEEAEKNGDDIVSIPVDNLEFEDDIISSRDWSDAKSLAEALENVLEKSRTGESILFMYLSY